MTLRSLALLLALAAAALHPAQAQPASPYAGEADREIKALSSEELRSYLAGQGMGFAKAAELNGYAGPAHVLELAAPLRLTPEQRERTSALFESMASRAKALGRELVDEERRLDRLFATRAVTPESLRAAVERIGALQARLRATHLEAHLAQVQILTGEQNARYAELRGYRGAGGHDAHGAGHGGAHKP